MILDLTSLIVIHVAMMATFGALFAAITWIDNDWDFPWHFSVGFLVAPSIMVLPGLGVRFEQPLLVLFGMISGFLGPAIVSVAIARLIGIQWQVTRWIGPFLMFAGAHLLVFLAGFGMIGHLLVLSVTIFAFSVLIFMIARGMSKSDFPLCRPMILTLVGIAAFGQLVRAALMIWEGFDNLDWVYSVKTMILGATVTAAFGVVIVVILVAERFSAQIRREARTDALTGLAARRVFDDQIMAELLRWKRYRRPFAIVLFDIDHFKRVNDSFGHAIGDDALRLVAECGRAQLRPSDLIARLGGDEFALLLPESDAEVALEVARRLHAALRSTPLKTQAGPYGLTGSFGVAVSDDPQDTVAQILKRADQALYRVKENGRDGVAVFSQAQAVQA